MKSHSKAGEDDGESHEKRRHFKHLWHSYDSFQNLLAFTWTSKKQLARQSDFLLFNISEMEDSNFSLILILGLDIAGQLSVLFVAITPHISPTILLSVIEKFQEAGFSQTPKVVLSNNTDVFQAIKSKFEDI